MKIIVSLVIAVILSFASDTIRFAPLPMENALKTLKIFLPMTKYLEKGLGKKIEIVYKGSNEEVVDGMIDKSIDIAYFGPLPYVDLTKRYKYSTPIVQFLGKGGKETYTCTMFIRDEENKSIKDIDNQKFALTQKYSTCGYAFAQKILNDKGLSMDNNSFKYIGSHYDTIIEVLSGSYDIGTAKTSIFNKFKHLGVKSISVSLPNPGLILIANSATISKADIETIKNLMLNATDEERRNWGEKIRNKSIVPNLKLFDEYKNRVKDIVLKDEK